MFVENGLIKVWPRNWNREWLLRKTSARQLRDELLHAPLETILHASKTRLWRLGLCTLVGHPLFYWIWQFCWPQPFESLWARCAMALLGVPLMFDRLAGRPFLTRTQNWFSVITFVQLPLFFSWMYVMNERNAVWLASLAAVTVIYYHLTDWRIAATGSVTGFLLGSALASSAVGTQVAAQQWPHLVVLAFAGVAGLLLGLSGANLRRERLHHSLTTIGIMAHELRTPLSTATLIADAMLIEARRQPEGPRASQLVRLAQRLHSLTRTMNHHIDVQISNARLLRLQRGDDRIGARALVADAVSDYPYRTTQERGCVEVVVHRDFRFIGSRVQFMRVIDNLLQNALRSLQASSSVLLPGDLRLEIGRRGREGRITVTDRGIGIDPLIQPRVFEPFFSTDQDTGHGLGLSFCKRVVLSANGRIDVRSQTAQGAVFTITLPLDDDEAASGPESA